MAKKCTRIVCAWGNFLIVKKLGVPDDFFLELQHKLYYISISKNKIPKHPLYLNGDLKMKKYLFKQKIFALILEFPTKLKQAKVI